MKKSVIAFTVISVLSIQSFSGNCGPHNLVGEWTRKTELASTPDAKCGNATVSEKTVYTFAYIGGKVSGHGLRSTVKSFQSCSAKSNSFKFPHAELLSNGSLSIVSQDGAQVVSDCDVSSDRTKVKISGVLYSKTK